jgi:hypothetical protein
MILSLDGIFAFTESKRWSPGEVRETLSTLVSALGGTHFDWDEPGESWGMVCDGRRPVAFVCVKLPIVIVLDTHEHAIEQCLSKLADVRVMCVEDFDQRSFRIDRATLESVFGNGLPNEVDYERFSVQELWWATV